MHLPQPVATYCLLHEHTANRAKRLQLKQQEDLLGWRRPEIEVERRHTEQSRMFWIRAKRPSPCATTTRSSMRNTFDRLGQDGMKQRTAVIEFTSKASECNQTPSVDLPPSTAPERLQSALHQAHGCSAGVLEFRAII